MDRGALAATLWPESDAEQALYNLRRNLTDLRTVLGVQGDRLLSPSPRTIRLDLHTADVDLLTFDAAVARGDPSSLEEAVSVYKGELLAGCLDEWILAERETRLQRYLAALETFADRATASGDHTSAVRLLRDDGRGEEGDRGRVQGDHTSAVRLLREALAADPLRETALRGLLQGLAARREFAAVTCPCQDFRIYLHREVNAEPAEETAALFRRLLDPDGGAPGLELAGFLLRYWEVRGYLTEGRERMVGILAHPSAQQPTRARSSALSAAANLARRQGDYPVAPTDD